MTDTAMSPLPRRMIEDMTIRRFAASTPHNYVRFVNEFTIFLGSSLGKASFEDVRRNQLHLIAGVSPSGVNSALRFFHRVTLQRFDVAYHTPLLRPPERLLSLRSELDAVAIALDRVVLPRRPRMRAGAELNLIGNLLQFRRTRGKR